MAEEISRVSFLRFAATCGAVLLAGSGCGESGVTRGAGTGGTTTRPATTRAATTGRLSRYCRGDGSDETAVIQKCFDENLMVEVDEPPAGVGYGFSGGSGILVRSGQEVQGMGERAKLLRVTGTSGKYAVNGAPFNNCFLNRDENSGGKSIRFENLYVDGQGRKEFGSSWDTTFRGVRLQGAAFALATNSSENASEDITLTDITILEWPGQSIECLNVVGWYATRVSSQDPARGGHVLINKMRDVRISACESLDSGDDSFALNSGELNNKGSGGAAKENTAPVKSGDPYADGFEISGCKTSTRASKIAAGGGNNGVAIRGGVNGNVERCTVQNPQKDGVVVQDYMGFEPKNVLVTGCDISDPGKDGIGVISSGTSGIRLTDNKISGPKLYGTSWTTTSKERAELTGCEDQGNEVTGAGKGVSFVQPELRGITVS